MIPTAVCSRYLLRPIAIAASFNSSIHIDMELTKRTSCRLSTTRKRTKEEKRLAREEYKFGHSRFLHFGTIDITTKSEVSLLLPKLTRTGD